MVERFTAFEWETSEDVGYQANIVGCFVKFHGGASLECVVKGEVFARTVEIQVVDLLVKLV